MRRDHYKLHAVGGEDTNHQTGHASMRHWLGIDKAFVAFR